MGRPRGTTPSSSKSQVRGKAEEERSGVHEQSDVVRPQNEDGFVQANKTVWHRLR